MTRRGFAMPIVIVLALVVGVLAAVVLERQAMQRRIVARQVNAYQDTHFERGVREIVSQWTDTLIGQSIRDLLEDDGHALDIDRPDGSVVSIYLFDGQGTLLSEPIGRNEQESLDAEGALKELVKLVGARRLHREGGMFLRPVGPAAVSAMTAPVEVLEAVAAYAREGKSGRRFAESIVEARRNGEVTEADLNTAFSAGDLSTQQREVARRLLVLEPEVWSMVVDVWVPRGRGGGELIMRYGGRFQMAGQGSQPGTTMVSLGRFLSWEQLPIDEERGN